MDGQTEENTVASTQESEVSEHDWLRDLEAQAPRIVRTVVYAVITACLVIAQPSPVGGSWALIIAFAVMAIGATTSRIAQLGMLLLTIWACLPAAFFQWLTG